MAALSRTTSKEAKRLGGGVKRGAGFRQVPVCRRETCGSPRRGRETGTKMTCCHLVSTRGIELTFFQVPRLAGRWQQHRRLLAGQRGGAVVSSRPRKNCDKPIVKSAAAEPIELNSEGWRGVPTGTRPVSLVVCVCVCAV